MRELWKFTTKEKMDKFIVILQSHEIDYEITAAEKNRYVISVNDSEYNQAKKVLLKHRERRTSADSINSNDKSLKIDENKP